MNYGLYLSASGVLTNLHRQDVLAANLANVQTTGFKPDQVVARERLPERLESGAPTDPKLMLERLGGGLLLDRTRTDLRSGALIDTGAPLDLAIEGDGFFIAAGSSTEDVRLTRDGRFTIDRDHRLVLAASGRPVLNDRQRPITLRGSGPIEIDGSGRITQGGSTVAQLGLVSATDEELIKAGENLFRYADPAPANRRPAQGIVRQGHIEQSTVDPVMTLNQMLATTRAMQASAKLMQYHDFIMGQTINTFGRVS